tara:strand:- start:318 stop:833 length:516 start_codon:yes stop_codon:yes gene_type:complete
MEILHSETFWVAVAFFIFIIISYKKGKQIIIEALDRRIENITKRINDTKKIKEEAENNLLEAKKNLKKIISERERILKEAKEESRILKKELEQQEKINNERFNKKIKERIEQSNIQVIKEIQKQAVEISLKSIKELLLKNVKKESNESDFITKSITNIFKKDKQNKNYKAL